MQVISRFATLEPECKDKCIVRAFVSANIKQQYFRDLQGLCWISNPFESPGNMCNKNPKSWNRSPGPSGPIRAHPGPSGPLEAKRITSSPGTRPFSGAFYPHLIDGYRGLYPIGSMVLLYMVTWIPSIYPLYVSIYTSTMDPMGTINKHL